MMIDRSKIGEAVEGAANETLLASTALRQALVAVEAHDKKTLREDLIAAGAAYNRAAKHMLDAADMIR